MQTLNILHISDVHIQKKDETEIKEIADKLFKDIEKVQLESRLKIDLICFTGDLIQRGDMAESGENQWDLAMGIFVEPLLTALDLTKNQFICVPGNHEVNIQDIVIATERGLKVKTLGEIDEMIKAFNEIYKSRLSYFYNNISNMYSDSNFGTLGYSFIRSINGIKVGIACIDSAWRSSGKGKIEKGELYVGIRQVRELYSQIEDAELKICMMHHPLEWLEECEVLEIEKILTNFDIVLRGHVHDEDDKQIIRQDLKTVYSTAGKIYPIDYAEGKALDGYNGYSILKVDLIKNTCTMILRTYYGKTRKEFAEATNICDKGIKVYYLNSTSTDRLLEFSIIKGLNSYFYSMSDSYSIIKNVDNQLPSDIRQILIDPVLADKSEYVKEEDSSKEVCLSDIIESENNILLIGKKESGKTTILQQIGMAYIESYERKSYIPVHIDMKKVPKGSDKLLNSTFHFIINNMLDTTSISKSEIRKMIIDGKILFLIDNVKTSNADHTILISNFIKEYCNNRYILTIEEEFFQAIEIKQIPSYGTYFREIYIQYMGKSQIRDLVTKWSIGKENVTDINDVVNKIDSYFNQINFPKTPFNIAVFMIIWDYDNNFVPVNEGIIMQNYLEIVLEKLSPEESLRSNYSFTIKQNFLSYLAHEMFLKDQYFFTKKDFDDKVNNYHEKKGYNLYESKFDKIFFDKNILSYTNDYVVFSHTSILEYFLAIYAVNDKEFLNIITKKGNRTNFRNEICFYSGLNQNCLELLNNLADTILDTVVDNLDLVDGLNNVEIMTEFKVNKEDLIQDIQRNRPTQNELDNVSDLSNSYKEKGPTEIVKLEVGGVEADDFYSILQMYGSVIKNAELLDNNYKIEHLENYMYGMNMLYAIMIKFIEYIKVDLKFEDLDEDYRRQFNIEHEEEFEEAKVKMVDISKLMFPIAIQNLILENVGTPKLGAAINKLINSKHDKPFENFMLTFLKCDLKIVKLKDDLARYIKNEKSKAILKLIMVKLTFYYRARFFGVNVQIDNLLIELITEVHMKLNPIKNQYLVKASIAQQLKEELDRTGTC